MKLRLRKRLLLALVPLLLLPLVPLLVQIIGYGIASAPNRGQPAPVDPDVPPLGAKVLRIPVAPPAAELVLWVLEPPVPPRGTVLLLHGIRAGKGQLRGLGEQLQLGGWRVVLPDLRGHGGSSGDYLSYGVHESQDLAQVLDWLARGGQLRSPLAAVGFSYGGSVALQLAARDERVRAVVAVATFAEMTTIVARYVHRALPPLSGLVPAVLVREGLDLARRLGRFDPQAASSVRAVARTRASVLLLHGDADEHIPADHSRAIQAAAPDRTELEILPGLNHNTLFQDPRTRQRIVDFLQRTLVSRP